MNDIIFLGINLTQELQKQLDSHKSAILSTAPPEAVKGYDLGVQNTLLLLESLLSSLEPNEFLINTTDSHLNEYDYDELEALVRKQVYKS